MILSVCIYFFPWLFPSNVTIHTGFCPIIRWLEPTFLDLAAVSVTRSGSVTGRVFAASRTAAKDSGSDEVYNKLCFRIFLKA